MLERLLRDAAEEEVAQAPATVRAKHDQIGPMLFGVHGNTARHISLRSVVDVHVDFLHPGGAQPARHILFIL